jgi:hypothetical protein
MLGTKMHGALFERPFFLSLTIGIPFCAFKLIFGISAVRAGAGGSPFLPAFGWIVIAWAATDLLMNLGRAGFDLLGRPAPFEYCTIAQIGSILRVPLIFLALDTFLAFVIICMMLWSGWIARLTPAESYIWYAATTANLISLSLVSVYNECMRSGGKAGGT